MLKRPDFDVPWHASDQPDILRDPATRRAARAWAWMEWAKTALTAGVVFPAAALAGARPRQGIERTPSAFLGVGVGALPGHEPGTVRALLDELGCRQVLLRLRLWDERACEETLTLARSLGDRRLLVVLCQDRSLVVQPRRWEQALRRWLALLPERVWGVQVGCAINRLKWGCAHTGEYLDLLERAGRVLRDHPRLSVLGGAVIDFDPFSLLRTLVNGRSLRMDGVAAQLYIDRWGGPVDRQLGLLDLGRKIRILAALVQGSPRCGKRLWITEMNWPLAGQRSFTPTSSRECIDEETCGRFAEEYLRIAHHSGLVEGVYWWQLAAQGYGLVDPDTLRFRPAFLRLQRLLNRGW